MILVIGGAGYIGSHAVKLLLDQGYQVVVFDNLSTGHQEAVDPRAVFVQGELGSRTDLDHLFSKYPIEGVMHFAAHIQVGESVTDPFKYYENNVASTLTLLSVMLQHGVKKLIFSSTAAVYGLPEEDVIQEELPANPINPYGRSKWMVEQILQDFSYAYGLEYVALRYFNAAGADQSGKIGEDHDPETHLIPVILQHLLGLREKITVFGTDYPTPDGTCIRDYIHVVDLVEAHIYAMRALLDNRVKNEAFNLGTGHGYSVKEVIDMCEKVTGKKATVEYGARREGDPPKLVASSEKMHRVLGWKPTHNLEDIVRTAWNWHRNHPNGYVDKRHHV
ncbi:UDP-glucose 4-epimerase GalE [Lihuaxuella thermophila]|uniref:UDP-glucose 4-epimerase n=1 Tax=Lihuaxuella thermophila TaxID=1173111 RepID=A0A1H8CGA3_9BACL|nr:UDP-glucose 4-epimerase GalE [Lihuaxuella thermophila]SEM93464.1 UDP-glucose 4-epimerase [Lihuaxuella thermophila]